MWISVSFDGKDGTPSATIRKPEASSSKAQVEVKEKRKRAIEESVGTDYGTFKTLHSGECSVSGIYFSDCVQER